MARNRTPKERREARQRQEDRESLARERHLSVRISTNNGWLVRHNMFARKPIPDAVVRFYRFIGVSDDFGFHISDNTVDWPKIDLLYAGLGQILKARAEGRKMKKFKHRLAVATEGV